MVLKQSSGIEDNNNMLKITLQKFLRLILGLFVHAIGVVCILNARVGVAPWDVLHQGLSGLIGITVGQANISTGLIIVVLDIYLGQPIGFGTISNMFLLGTFMDVLMLNNLVPFFEGYLPRILQMFAGIAINGIAVFLYMGVGWGAGPRDGLMVALMKRTGRSVRFIKTVIEGFAVVVGFILGGNLGIGTIIVAFLSGPIWQYMYKILKFDLNEVEHLSIQEHIKLIKENIAK